MKTNDEPACSFVGRNLELENEGCSRKAAFYVPGVNPSPFYLCEFHTNFSHHGFTKLPIADAMLKERSK